jgi:hypothetical protein
MSSPNAAVGLPVVNAIVTEQQGVPTKVEERVRELIEPISSGAEQASAFADMLLGASSVNTQGVYEQMDDEQAKQYVEELVVTRVLPLSVGSVRLNFQSIDILLDSLDQQPFGTTQIVDEMTERVFKVPVLESEQAGVIREIMGRIGIVPLYLSSEGSIVYAIRVDDQTSDNIVKMLKTEAKKALEEIRKLNPNLELDDKIGGVIPVSSATYDIISSSVSDPKYRASQAVRSCDAHFRKETEAYNVIDGVASNRVSENIPFFQPLQMVYPGDSEGTIVREMHYAPFVAMQTGLSADKQSTSKQSLPGTFKVDVASIFDGLDIATPDNIREAKDSKVLFLLRRCASKGFLPLKIETNEANEPVVIVGFRAYESNADDSIATSLDGTSYQKRNWDEVLSSAREFFQTLQNTFPDQIPADVKVSNMVLTPIPNHYFPSLLGHISDPKLRKDTLNIIDKSSGVLNYQRLLEYAVKIGAQEVYLALDSSGPRVRFDVAGNVIEAPFKYSVDAFVKTIQSLVAIMSNQHANVNMPIEGSVRFDGCTAKDFALWLEHSKKGETLPSVQGKDTQLSIYPRSLAGIALRLEYTPLITGPQIVARIHRLQQKPPDLNNLGLRPEILKSLNLIIQRTSGAIFVVAPTGAGKTTLLAAILQKKNKPETVITTLEHPVEFIIPGISQVELNEPRGLTGLVALKAALRSAPHIVMVGEARDKEEATIALEAAATGHLLFSTMHTSDAPEAFLRFKLMGIDPFFVANQVNVIIAQRLIRQFTSVKHSLQYQADKSMLEQYDCRSELEALMLKPGVFKDPIMVYKPRAAKLETGQAFKGRVPVNEIIVKFPELQQMLLNPSWSLSDLTNLLVNTKNVEVPFSPMICEGLKWVLEGRTSIEALYQGDKAIPREQFIVYAPQIIEMIQAWQAEHHT